MGVVGCNFGECGVERSWVWRLAWLSGSVRMLVGGVGVIGPCVAVSI